MDLDLPVEVGDYGAATRRLLADGGVVGARYGPAASVEARRLLVERLDEFGLFDLDVVGGGVDALIAGVVLEELGRGAAAVPAVGLLCGRAMGVDGPLFAVDRVSDRALVDAVDLFPTACVVDRLGAVADSSFTGEVHPRLLARFAGWADVSGARDGDVGLWCLHEVLAGFVALGVAVEAVELARVHLNEREQFGRPLKAFQALQHRFADMVVSASGLRELCYYTLWAWEHRPSSRMADALMLRAHQLKVSAAVVAGAHQVHAAIGFCHEHPLIDLTSSTVLARQVPLTLGQTFAALEGERDQIETIFGERERRRYQSTALEGSGIASGEAS
jgi:hypothetical protein